MSFEVQVPASSANLGPGFDSLALAIDLYMHVRVWPSEPGVENAIEDIDLYGGEDLVLASMQHMARMLGRALPAFSIESTSDIPVARGLGSSAAAIVAGLQAGATLLGMHNMSSSDIIRIGGELEGHADNISAAVLGGVTAAVSTDEGYLATQLATCLAWQPVLFIPRLTAFTRDARGILPDQVPLADASANAGRSALLVHAFASGDDALLTVAMEDRLHQPYRARLFPHLTPMIAAARGAGASGACLSGAGPTVLALTRPESVDSVRRALERVAREMDVEGSVVNAMIASRGSVVRTLGGGADDNLI